MNRELNKIYEIYRTILIPPNVPDKLLVQRIQNSIIKAWNKNCT